MAIGWVALTGGAGGSGTGVASFSLTKPTGFVNSCVLLLGVASNNGAYSGGSFTKDTGGYWTRVAAGEDQATANVGLSIFYRVVPTASAEPSTYGFSFVQSNDNTTSQTCSYGWVMGCFSGVDNATPLDVTAPATTGTPTSGATSIACTATSSVTDQAWVVAFASNDVTSGGWTAPAGYSATDMVSQLAGRACVLSTKGPITPAGSIAAASFTQSAGAPGVGDQVVLRPAGAVVAVQQQLMLLGVGA